MIWLLQLLTLQLCAPRHDFKMSICEIVYVSEQQRFDVRVYLFTDDFTEALTGNPKAPLPAHSTLTDYVGKHLDIAINGTAQKLTFQSIKQKGEQVQLTFSCSPTPLAGVRSIRARDNLLTEKFRDQTNMVYLVLPNHARQVQSLDAKNTEANFKL